MVVYVSAVLFFCLYQFTNTGIDLSKYFLGIRMDRIAHFTMFLPYSIVCWILLTYNTRIREGFIKYIIIIITGISFAALAEYSQSFFTSYRMTDDKDFIANIIGILAGCALAFSFKRLTKAVCNYISGSDK